MRISAMLQDRNTKPMQIVAHKDFSRASWLLRAETYTITDKEGRPRVYRYDTPLDSMLRETTSKSANKLAELGL